MSRPRSWQVPYSVDRLVRLCRTWDFRSDVDDLPDCEDGAPRMFCAVRRVGQWLRDWRDRHGPMDDPWDDESLCEFHVADVAMLYSEYVRLSRLVDRVEQALGPPTVTKVMRRGRMEEE